MMKRKICFAILLLFIFYYDFAYFDITSEDVSFVLINFLFSLIILFQLFKRKKLPFSINDVFLSFYFFFFGIAPIFQYFENVDIWGGIPFVHSDYSFTMLISLFAIIVYICTYNHFLKRSSQIRAIFFSPKEYRIRWFLLVIISLGSFIVYFRYCDFNVFSLFLRGGDLVTRETLSEASTMESLMVEFFFRPMPVVCLLIYRVFGGKNVSLQILFFIIILLTDAPTGMPRFLAASCYLPLCLVYIPFMRRKYNFVILLMISVLFFFPVLDVFRHFDSHEVSIQFNFSMFNTGNFDSFQMFMRVIKENIVTAGSQLLGCLFFFIPRSLWPSKPVGSGHFVADVSSLNFDNISLNYLGEGFVNFGYVGIFLFAIVIAYINAFWDRKFWYGLYCKPISFVYYLLILGMEFVILRGQLMSFYPILIGYLFSAFALYKLVVCQKV